MSGTTKNGVGKIITYIAVLLIFVLIFGVLGFFTNGFTSDFKTFYVENNGEKILNDKENYTISTGSDYRFDVKYTFGFMQKSQKLGYHVKVVPNTAKDTRLTSAGEIVAPSEMTRNLYNNALKTACQDMRTTHAQITVNYRNYYGNTTYKNDTFVLQVKLDLSALATRAESITTSESGLIF